MAQAVCCDRCGKFARAGSKDVAGWVGLTKQMEGEPVEILLCVACNMRFEEFLRPPAIREG